MTAAVEHLLQTFDRLSEGERHEAASEILKRVLMLETPPLDDETLDRLAEDVFLGLDEREAAGGHSSPG